MDGFKDSTKTQYSSGGSVKGPKGAAKVSKVMREYKEGTLHSGSAKGPKVTSPAQAVAIALSEGRKVAKKANGGRIPTLAELEQSNRDTGGMDAKAERAARAAVARGNRVQAEEAAESALLRKYGGAPKAAPRRGPAGSSFNAKPLVGR